MITFKRQLSRNFKQLRTFNTSSILSSKKDEADGKDKEKKLSKEEVTTKLNDLLKLMTQKEDDQPIKEVQVPQAVKRQIQKPEKPKSLGDKLEGAAKEVAATLGGDVQQTESELLNILLHRSEASTQLLKDVLTGIKVEQSPQESVSRAQQVRDTLARQSGRSIDPSEPLSVSASMKLEMRKSKKMSAVQMDILNAAPSSYFKNLKPQPAPCELRTWQSGVDRDMRLAVTHPPTNIYEQMILWTNRGMFWQFPIDNEQGLGMEKQVSFEEHIFMEDHLEGWCPDKGPVRHFMELICVGLSKNYWLTVEEKKSHIMWFRDYFADKKVLLEEIGAGTITVETGEQKETNKSLC